MAAKIIYGDPPKAPLLFSPSVEKPEPDEAQTFSELVDTLRGITETTSKDYGHSVRAVHAMSTGRLSRP